MGKLEEAGTSVEVIGYWTRDELQRTGSVGKFSRRWQSNHEMNMMLYIFRRGGIQKQDRDAGVTSDKTE